MTGWRIEIALARLARALRRRGVGYRRRRDIVADVRANLSAASRDFGEREAVRRLGEVRTLAAEYAQGERTDGLRLGSGARAALLTCALLLGLTLIRIPTFGTIDAFDPHTGATTWSWGVWRLWRFGGDTRTDTLFEGTVYSYAYILIALLVMLVWSRPWRLLSRPSRGQSSATASSAQD